jgi:RHS repeat-associated protein
VWRQETPFGAPRGTPPSSWPDSNGFLGKPADGNTGLTVIGARNYDPSLGRFTSVDPVLEQNSPQQLGGYAYAGDNPATQSDPAGLMACDANGVCGTPQSIVHAEQQQLQSDYQGAMSQQIDNCGGTQQCAARVIREFANPNTAVQQMLSYQQAQDQLLVQSENQQLQQMIARQQAQQSSGFWGTFVRIVHDVAPAMTVLALVTFALPGVDVLTGALAMAVQTINVASVGFDVASAAVSGVNMYHDFASGASFGKTAFDTLGFATSLAGAGAGFGALRSGFSATRAEAQFVGETRSAIRAQSTNLLAGDTSGMSNFLETTGLPLAGASSAASHTAELWNAANFATSVTGELDMAGTGLAGN